MHVVYMVYMVCYTVEPDAHPYSLLEMRRSVLVRVESKIMAFVVVRHMVVGMVSASEAEFAVMEMDSAEFVLLTALLV